MTRQQRELQTKIPTDEQVYTVDEMFTLCLAITAVNLSYIGIFLQKE